jgi:hypothetical protein
LCSLIVGLTGDTDPVGRAGGDGVLYFVEVLRFRRRLLLRYCRKFAHNAVRLQLHALAYNLGTSCEPWPCPMPCGTGR